MSDHSNLVKWYVKREEASHAKNAMHKKIFLETLEKNPEKHVEGIKNSLTTDVIYASVDIGSVEKENLKSLPYKLVEVYTQHFLHGNKINLDYIYT